MKVNSPKYYERFRERNSLICQKRKEKETLDAIASMFGITRQRVLQILGKMSVDKSQVVRLDKAKKKGVYYR